MNKFVALAVFAVLVIITATFGAQFTPGEWYAALDKPAWNPPSWLFAPVWTVLYVMIALAGLLAWRNDPSVGSKPMLLWGAQLILNALWSWLFFGEHLLWVAFADIVALELCIFAFIAATWTRARGAALLFIPYAMWVGFASCLNFTIAWLNT